MRHTVWSIIGLCHRQRCRVLAAWRTCSAYSHSHLSWCFMQCLRGMLTGELSFEKNTDTALPVLLSGSGSEPWMEGINGKLAPATPNRKPINAACQEGSLPAEGAKWHRTHFVCGTNTPCCLSPCICCMSASMCTYVSTQDLMHAVLLC